MENPQLENGHLDIANELVEALARTQLSGYESRVLWAVFRKTYGWHKKEDWMSFNQLRVLTQLKDSHISRTLKLLVMRKILTKGGKLLSFNKYYNEWGSSKGLNTHHLPKGVSKINLPKGVTALTKGGKKYLPKGADTNKKPKETITKDIPLLSPKIKNKYTNALEFEENVIEELRKKFPFVNVPDQLDRARDWLGTFKKGNFFLSSSMT